LDESQVFQIPGLVDARMVAILHHWLLPWTVSKIQTTTNFSCKKWKLNCRLTSWYQSTNVKSSLSTLYLCQIISFLDILRTNLQIICSNVGKTDSATMLCTLLVLTIVEIACTHFGL